MHVKREQVRRRSRSGHRVIRLCHFDARMQIEPVSNDGSFNLR